MKKFIVYQQQVDSETRNGADSQILISTVIRLVYAKSEEEAIGKFVLETKNIPAKQKLNVECIELSVLKSIL